MSPDLCLCRTFLYSLLHLCTFQLLLYLRYCKDKGAKVFPQYPELILFMQLQKCYDYDLAHFYV